MILTILGGIRLKSTYKKEIYKKIAIHLEDQYQEFSFSLKPKICFLPTLHQIDFYGQITGVESFFKYNKGYESCSCGRRPDHTG